jgi:hypothetical protein
LVADLLNAHGRSPGVVCHGRGLWCVGVFSQAHLPALVAEFGLRGEVDDTRAAVGGGRQAARLGEGLAKAMRRHHAAC